MADLDSTLRDLGVYEFVGEADSTSLVRSIAFEDGDELAEPGHNRLPRYGLLFEAKGLDAYRESLRDSEGAGQEARSWFGLAFACWRSLASTGQIGGEGLLPSMEGASLVDTELPSGLIPADLSIAFRLAVTGLLAQQPAATRHDLGRFDLSPRDTAEWPVRVLSDTLRAFCLLTRKREGWTDIDDGLMAISELRERQSDFEEDYLGGLDDPPTAAIGLVGLYHTAHLISLAGEYLRDGSVSPAAVRDEVDRHQQLALQALAAGELPMTAHLVDLLWVGCRELVANSIWTHMATVSAASRRFARLLTARGRLSDAT